MRGKLARPVRGGVARKRTPQGTPRRAAYSTPGLLTAITDRLPAAVPDLAAATHTEHRNGHRITRTIWTAPADGVDYPGATQVFRIRRDTYAPDGQRVSKHILHGVTSLMA